MAPKLRESCGERNSQTRVDASKFTFCGRTATENAFSFYGRTAVKNEFGEVVGDVVNSHPGIPDVICLVSLNLPLDKNPDT